MLRYGYVWVWTPRGWKRLVLDMRILRVWLPMCYDLFVFWMSNCLLWKGCFGIMEGGFEVADSFSSLLLSHQLPLGQTHHTFSQAVSLFAHVTYSRYYGLSGSTLEVDDFKLPSISRQAPICLICTCLNAAITSHPFQLILSCSVPWSSCFAVQRTSPSQLNQLVFFSQSTSNLLWALSLSLLQLSQLF